MTPNLKARATVWATTGGSSSSNGGKKSGSFGVGSNGLGQHALLLSPTTRDAVTIKTCGTCNKTKDQVRLVF